MAHTDNILCMDTHWEGKVIATGGRDRLVRLWDVRSSKQIAVLKGHRG